LTHNPHSSGSPEMIASSVAARKANLARRARRA
jgi:hypothetical protein